MVLANQKIDFGGNCLIEKIIIQPPFRFTGNLHNEACFVYFLEGNTIINSPTEQELVESEEVVLLKCGNYFSDLVQSGKGDKYEILVFHLYPDVLREIYSHEIPAFMKPSENKSFIHKIAPNTLIKNFIQNLCIYFDNPELVSDELLKLKIKELILLLIQTRNAESIVSLFSDLFSPRSLNIKDVVVTHLFSNLSVDELANLANLSVSTFNRTFQAIFRDTPANYIKIKRLERARELLSMSLLTVREVAFRTCFNDVAHFSRSFKAVYNYSPTEYRLSQKLG